MGWGKKSIEVKRQEVCFGTQKFPVMQDHLEACSFFYPPRDFNIETTIQHGSTTTP
jgi:hypothetical protein